MPKFRNGTVLQYGGLLLLLAGFLGAETCTVIRVSEGDTLRATCSEITRNIRISSIDAPELGQPYGPEAKQATTDLVLGREVAIHAVDYDKYDRTVARVTLAGGLDLGRELVRLGYAWHYVRYSQDAELGWLETQARSARAGLWADSFPEPPSVYRKAKRELPVYSKRGQRRSQRRFERRRSLNRAEHSWH